MIMIFLSKVDVWENNYAQYDGIMAIFLEVVEIRNVNFGYKSIIETFLMDLYHINNI